MRFTKKTHQLITTGGNMFSRSKRSTKSIQELTAALLRAIPMLLVLAGTDAIADHDESNAGFAETGEQQFEIPPQDLTSALNAFAETTRLQVSFPAEIANGKTSPGVQGQYTPMQALRKLLEGSGLDYRITQNQSITLEEPRAGSLSTASLLAMSPKENFMYAAADSETVASDGPVEQEDLTVRGASLSGYTVLNANTATKTDTPLIETPVSVQVVPRTVMDDQKSTRIKDALENVSGVRPNTTIGSGNGFIIRGFRNTRVYRNGLLSNFAFGFPSEYDAGNLQSIEVLKGPAAVLYGRIEPGGLINITTKKPLDSPYYSLEQQFGSYDFYRTQWDATGPLTEDNSLLYRFTGAYQNNNSFRDFVFTDRVMVNPTITWRPTDSTDLTLNIEGLDQDYKSDLGIPVIGNRPAPIPIGRSLDDPNIPTSHISHTFVSTEINHHFNEDWAVHHRFLAGFADEFNSFAYATFDNLGPGSLLDSSGILHRNIVAQSSANAVYNTNLDLTGSFEFEFSKHEVLVGFDYYQSTVEYSLFGEFDSHNPALDIDIFNPAPSYGISPALIHQTLSQIPSCCTTTAYNFYKNEWYGVYFQDHITLWDKLHILGGGRYDWTLVGRSQSGGSINLAESAFSSRKNQRFNPRVGILYEPVSWLGLYGNWTTSFNPNSANAPTSANATILAPETGEQFEAGFKTQLFDDRLIATLAFYHLVRDNILVPDLTTSDPFDRIPNKQRSQGFELDVTGQITDRLSVIGSYAYTDAKILVDHNGNTAGNRLPNIPRHGGSLFVKYDANGYEAPEGFSLGLGTVAAGQRQGDFQNSFQLPGFVRVDAFAAYRMKVGPTRIITQFNIRNLLDKTFYESTDPDSNTSPRLGVYPGAPLTAIGSIRVEY